MTGTIRKLVALASCGAVMWLAACPPLAAAEGEDLWKRFVAKRDAGQYREAEPLAQKLVAMAEKSFADKPVAIASASFELGRVRYMMGNFVDAEEPLKRALVIAEKALGPDDPGVAWILNLLARDYYQLGRDDEAEPLFRRAVAILEKARGPDHLDVASALMTFT